MTITQAQLDQFSYLKSGINANVVDYLLAELDRVRVPKATASIPLPHGDEFQYLPIDLAYEIIITWGTTHNFIYEEDLRYLNDSKLPLKQRINRLNLRFRRQVQDSNKLVTSALTQNVQKYLEEKNRALNQIQSSDKFDSLQALQEYNNSVTSIKTYLRNARNQQLLSQLTPNELVRLDNRVVRLDVEDIILNNLSELYNAAERGGSNPQLRAALVANKFDEIVHSTRPDLSSVNLSLGDPSRQIVLSSLVDHVVQNNLNSGGVSLSDLANQKTAAAQALDTVLPSYSQLNQQLISAVSTTLSSADEQKKLAENILRQLVKDGHTDQFVSAHSLIENAARASGLTDSQAIALANQLYSSPIGAALDYRLSESRSNLLSLDGRNFADRQLINKGLLPTIPTDPTAHQNTVAKFLTDFNQVHNSSAQTLDEAYQIEQSSSSPSLVRLGRINHLRDGDFFISISTNTDRRLAQTSQFGRKLLHWSDKMRETEARFYDKWFEFEEKLPWNRASRWAFKQYDKLAEKAIITIKRKGKKDIKIPLLNLTGWAFDTWHQFKEGWIKKQLIKLRGTKNIFGKFSQTLLRNYAKGDYTIGGMFYSWTREAVGKSLNWLAKKAGYTTAKEFGKAILAKTAEFGGKLLTKLGGKALFNLGVKLSGELVAALAGISSGVLSALGIVFAALMVWDLVKLGFNFVKELITNLDFREKVIKAGMWAAGIGVALGTFIASISFAPLGIFIASLLIGSFIWSTSLIPIMSSYYRLSVQTLPGLDVKYDPPASAANLGAASGCKDQQIPAPAGAGIPTRASEIVADLHGGFWGYCNRPTNPEKTGPGSAYSTQFPVKDEPKNKTVYLLSNRPNLFDYDLFKTNQDPTREEIQTSGNALYWCTYLVQHSYRESGKSGFSTSLWSPTLEDEFRASHTFIEGSAANSSNVKPGDIVFFKTDDGPDRTNHVGVVNDVLSNGFSYYQSNAPTINGNGTFDGSGASAEPGIMVVGFGRLK